MKTETVFKEIGKGVAFRPELSDMMESILFFKDFSRPDIENLATYVESYRVSEGSSLIREHQQDGKMYFIINGQVDLYKENSDGSQKKLTSIRKGRILGEMSVIDNLPASATAITAIETDIILLTHEKLQKLCNEKPALSVKLLWSR